MINNIINQIINNFDFAYMFSINVLTYIIIKILDYFNGNKVISLFIKRLCLMLCIIIVTAIYCFVGYTNKIILVNSAIVAPVFYSWILRPILMKFNIGYNQFDKYLN